MEKKSSTTPHLTATPSSLSFTAQQIGTGSAPETVTLSNAGTTAVSVTSLAITSPTHYSVVSHCATLQPNQSCTVAVTFKPLSPGSLPGQLTVNHSGGGEPLVISLTGTGIPSVKMKDIKENKEGPKESKEGKEGKEIKEGKEGPKEAKDTKESAKETKDHGSHEQTAHPVASAFATSPEGQAEAEAAGTPHNAFISPEERPMLSQTAIKAPDSGSDTA